MKSGPLDLDMQDIGLRVLPHNGNIQIFCLHILHLRENPLGFLVQFFVEEDSNMLVFVNDLD